MPKFESYVEYKWLESERLQTNIRYIQIYILPNIGHTFKKFLTVIDS